jgi:hypothetical protein
MSSADDVRQHCKTNYIDPARDRCEKTVAIKSGDVHKDMGFTNRYPLVCGAIGARVFEELCNVRRISIEGPINGTTTVFTFELL